MTQSTSNERTEIPAGLWTKCKGCEQMMAQSALAENAYVCPACGYHYPATAMQRINSLLDPDSFQEINASLASFDPLHFANDNSYAVKLQENKAKTNLNEAVITGFGSMNAFNIAIAIMDFRFMGASMGSAVGEKITRLIEEATVRKLPLIIITASGGARMQEGALSLMQMAKTSAALLKHDEEGLPYFTVLTNPTAGGVTASFASLGDVIIAEPKAFIGFAGPRVIKNTTQADLPEGFQTAEFLLEHGLIDRVTPRTKLRAELTRLLEAFAK